MGSNRFKFSDMIPNAWFYKLRDMGKNNRYRYKKTGVTSSSSSSSSSSVSNSSSLFSSLVSTDSNPTSIPHKPKQTHLSLHRKSYYFTRDLSPPHSHSVFDSKLPNSPIKSPKPRSEIREHGTSFGNRNSPSSLTSESLNSVSVPIFKYNEASCDVSGPNSERKSPKPKIGYRGNRAASEKGNYPKKGFCNANLNTSGNNSIGLDPISERKSPNSPQLMTRKGILCDDPNCRNAVPSDSGNSVTNSGFQSFDTNASGFYPVSKSKLPRIITKMETDTKKEKKINTPRKQRSSVFTGVRLRSNSPRIGKIDESGRKSFNSGRRRKIPESFAVVKSSSDPRRDFRESMTEMIIENGIDDSKELEDLLFCYLQLNYDVYHDVIIEEFKQLWFDLAIVKV